MKLYAATGKAEVEVEVRRDGDRIQARVDGREYQLEAHPSPAGISLLAADGLVFDCRIDGQTSSGQTVDVFVGASHYAVAIIDPKRLRGATGAGAHADGSARIVAPMPGKIVRVLAEKGSEVEAGAGIVVVEAMKMQNEMKSPKTGIVVAMNVEVGATVNGGDVLAVIE
jgi:biotin carboxyl carrier protein